ncbi:MAG: iron-containing alcohol dehydrogenase [Bacteroidales bacterium]|jgi:glycerol-1-phosphate dehydrogenase [NAD(P)+]|nr:iron-containing alcohol dehydrogenase [Bacteroidales bacterium]MCI1785302.1 iron-containing alcohol dehydrogenase [Bacteroidales bacterium]
MFYDFIKIPAVVKTGNHILGEIDDLLCSSHLYFPKKILITQENLYNLYKDSLDGNDFFMKIFVQGGNVSEAPEIIEKCKETDAILIAFGGGSVIDIVKYCANKIDKPYVCIPSTLSNDAVYSSVARLTCNGKKTSFGVQPPVGIIVDFDVIKKSPKILILAGVADLTSNLSALQDWLLSHRDTGEPINEIAFMLSKESVMPLFSYGEKDLLSDPFLFDLTNGLITSGLSMIVCGSTRVTSGAEHLISHAIDEYFPEKSTIHGLQVGWAHRILERRYRKGPYSEQVCDFFYRIGLDAAFKDKIPWNDGRDFDMLIPYARKIRNRYTVLNLID